MFKASPRSNYFSMSHLTIETKFQWSWTRMVCGTTTFNIHSQMISEIVQINLESLLKNLLIFCDILLNFWHVQGHSCCPNQKTSTRWLLPNPLLFFQDFSCLGSQPINFLLSWKKNDKIIHTIGHELSQQKISNKCILYMAVMFH